MVTTPAVVRRLDRDLASLKSFLDDFPILLDQWDDLEEGPRVTLSLEWDHLMADYLTELDEFYRAGHMTPEQIDQYRDLLSQLKESLPLVDRLSFWRPPVSLEP